MSHSAPRWGFLASAVSDRTGPIHGSESGYQRGSGLHSTALSALLRRIPCFHWSFFRVQEKSLNAPVTLTARADPRDTALLAKQGSQPQRSRTLTRSLFWVRLIGLIAIIGYGVVGAYQGVFQQRTGLSAREIDCPYRVSLIRDRVVALTQRLPHQSLHDPQDDVVSTLIRETQAACPDPDAQHKLERISERLGAYQSNRTEDAKARHELLAL